MHRPIEIETSPHNRFLERSSFRLLSIRRLIPRYRPEIQGQRSIPATLRTIRRSPRSRVGRRNSRSTRLTWSPFESHSVLIFSESLEEPEELAGNWSEKSPECVYELGRRRSVCEEGRFWFRLKIQSVFSGYKYMWLYQYSIIFLFFFQKHSNVEKDFFVTVLFLFFDKLTV